MEMEGKRQDQQFELLKTVMLSHGPIPHSQVVHQPVASSSRADSNASISDHMASWSQDVGMTGNVPIPGEMGELTAELFGLNDTSMHSNSGEGFGS